MEEGRESPRKKEGSDVVIKSDEGREDKDQLSVAQTTPSAHFSFGRALIEMM
jgi:hypothetical protein